MANYEDMFSCDELADQPSPVNLSTLSERDDDVPR